MVPCPSLSDLPPVAKMKKPTNARIPKIGADRLVTIEGAPDATEERIIKRLRISLLIKTAAKKMILAKC